MTLSKNPGAGDDEYDTGDLVFSRTGCTGVILYNLMTERKSHNNSYIVLWTVKSSRNGYYFKEQLREESSFSRK